MHQGALIRSGLLQGKIVGTRQTAKDEKQGCSPGSSSTWIQHIFMAHTHKHTNPLISTRRIVANIAVASVVEANAVAAGDTQGVCFLEPGYYTAGKGDCPRKSVEDKREKLGDSGQA